MADIMMNLKTFQPEYEAGTNEPLLRLRCRAKGLTANACAHAIFFCKLLQATRQKENEGEDVPGSPEPVSTCNQCLKIGIIGGGHMGKQLARTLLQLGGFSEKCIQISTRRPETLSEFQKLGVDCFYNNKQLVSWADVVFLCCLPFHLPHICSEIQDTIQKHSIIYSIVTAIPLPRLKHLLSCNTILRPQYTFTDGGIIQMWEASRTVVETLQDPAVIQATCPCSPEGEIFVGVKWLAGVFYAALNSYTLQNMSYMRALGLLNEVCSFEKTVPSPVEDNSKPPLLVCENFINQAYAACLGPDDAFPWFDLTAVQLKESPFSQLLATDKYFHDHIASFYCKTLSVVPARKEDSEITISKKIPLSAVLLHPDKAFSFIINAPCANKAEDESTTESEDA